MTKSTDTPIAKFFEHYAAATLKGDAKTIAAAYAGTYIEAAPAAVIAYTVDAEYRKALVEKSSTMKDRLGLSSVEADLKTIKKFAPGHFLVDVEWTMTFAANGRDPAKSRFLISYVVRLKDRTPMILLSVSHEDEEAVMKRDGVI